MFRGLPLSHFLYRCHHKASLRFSKVLLEPICKAMCPKAQMDFYNKIIPKQFQDYGGCLIILRIV